MRYMFGIVYKIHVKVYLLTLLCLCFQYKDSGAFVLGPLFSWRTLANMCTFCVAMMCICFVASSYLYIFNKHCQLSTHYQLLTYLMIFFCHQRNLKPTGRNQMLAVMMGTTRHGILGFAICGEMSSSVKSIGITFKMILIFVDLAASSVL